MIKFYYHTAPNPTKVALMLEELGLPYEVVPVDIRRGDQHAPSFLAINPNAKTPAIIDDGTRVFDSNAILLYLADKHARFAPPPADPLRGELLSWLMFVASGIGPYCGQAVHFKHYAPEKLPYALHRYMFEADRHWSIAESRLSGRRYLLGEQYTIADMALWGWARTIPFLFGEEAWARRPNLKRLLDEINARPAAVRAEALRERFKFKSEMDEEARKVMFPHLHRHVA